MANQLVNKSSVIPRAPGQWLPAVLLAVTVAAGSYVRVVDLAGPDFHNDEVYHVMAAQSLAEGNGPVLPSGREYRRGLDITRIVSVLQQRIAPPELAARLPSAAFGIIALMLLAVFSWVIAGPWAAFWATLFLTIYPEAIIQSRQVRFYTYQLCFGLMALYTGWMAVRPEAQVPAAERQRSVRRRWGWSVATVLLFLLAARVQPVTLSVAMAWFVVMAILAARPLLDEGLRAFKTSWRVQFVALSVLAAGLVALFSTDRLAGWIDLVSYVPVWAGSEPGDVRYYYWALSADFPVLFSLFPAIILYLWTRTRRLALFLACWFAVPFILHSFGFAWKAERYIFVAMPAFFLAAGIASASLWRTLFHRLESSEWTGHWLGSRAKKISACFVALAALGFLVTTPAFNEARNSPLFPKDQNWTAVREILAQEPGSRSVPLGSGLPESALYYLDRVDFGVSRTRLEDPSSAVPGNLQQDGVPDIYTGVPTLTQPQSIRSEFPDAPAVFVIFDREHHHLSNELFSLLSTSGTELCNQRCGDLLLYRLLLE